MRKLIIIGFMLSSSIMSYGQNEADMKETLEWIKSKVEAYPLCKEICYSANVKYDLELNLLSITYRSNVNNQITYIIPLKDVNSSKITYSNDYLFKIETFGASITWDEINSEGVRKVKKVSSVNLVFDGAQVRANDLESGLKQAFNKAVRLSGGIIAKEGF